MKERAFSLSATPRVFDTAIEEEAAGNFHAPCFISAIP
jgi:hypothetical protein